MAQTDRKSAWLETRTHYETFLIDITVSISSLPSAGIKAGCCLTVGAEEGQSWALLCTQLDAVGGSLAGEEVTNQLNLTVLNANTHKELLQPSNNSVLKQIIKHSQTNLKIWSNIPTSHSQPLPFVFAESPHPLGCEHVLVWPPRLPSPSLLWWESLCRTRVPSLLSAICDGSHQSFVPIE